MIAFLRRRLAPLVDAAVRPSPATHVASPAGSIAVPAIATLTSLTSLATIVLGSLATSLATSFAASFATAAAAAEWPDRTTRIVAPFAPGSTPDLVARLLADRLSKNTGQSFYVDDKPGAGGMIGTAAIAHAPADGATFGVSIGGPLVNNTVLYKSMAYDPFRDLVPITRLVDQPCLLVAAPTFRASTVAAMLAELKATPNRYNYASLGNGTVSHLVMVLIAGRARADLTQVPYPGSAQAVAALIAGDAALACLPPSNVMPQVKAGHLKLLGVASRTRSPLFPDVPTLTEQGLAGVEANAWIGVVAPAATPPAVVARMQAEIAKALADPEVARTLQAQYMEPVGDPPPQFAAYLREELARWRPIIEANHITLD